jgi:peptidyl-prolyl cis-trans isomerase SurA
MTKQSRPIIAWLGSMAMLASSGAWTQTRELGSSGQLLDGVAAVVDDGIVLKSELSQRLELVMNSLAEQQRQTPAAQRQPLPPLSVLERQVLDQLVLKEIQLQRANRVGITVGDEVLNQALSQVAAGLGITLEQLPDALAAENIDYNMYREDSRQEAIIGQLTQRDVLSRIAITPRELQQCLARTEATQTDQFDYNVSHILIGISSSASQSEIRAAEQRVDELLEKLDAGESFAQLAVTYSEAQTALEGGALGWRKGSELPTLFSDTVVRMQAGDHSAPIKNGSGFHIVRLNEMRGAERVVVDQVHARHILIAPNEILDDAAVQQRLRGIRDQIMNGDAFSTVATSVSEDTVSAADGGDLGWVEPEDFVPEFTEVLTQLQPGVISEPFRTRFGWHIVEVTDRRTYDTTDEMKREGCVEQIRAGKAQEEREMWLRRLRDQAFVDIRL